METDALLAFGLALLVAGIATPPVAWLARRIGAVDAGKETLEHLGYGIASRSRLTSTSTRPSGTAARSSGNTRGDAFALTIRSMP